LLEEDLDAARLEDTSDSRRHDSEEEEDEEPEGHEEGHVEGKEGHEDGAGLYDKGVGVTCFL
jgi:hypothetical protein